MYLSTYIWATDLFHFNQSTVGFFWDSFFLICSNMSNQTMYQTVHLLGCVTIQTGTWVPTFNPLNADLNPICHLLALLAAHHILHVSRIRVNRRFLPLSSG